MIKLFISHSSTDKELAEKLTELVKNALRLSSDEIRCTTIDGFRLPGGAKTNEQIKCEVRESIAFIGLISTAAADSMYVLFELGREQAYCDFLGEPWRGDFFGAANCHQPKMA